MGARGALMTPSDPLYGGEWRQHAVGNPVQDNFPRSRLSSLDGVLPRVPVQENIQFWRLGIRRLRGPNQWSDTRSLRKPQLGPAISRTAIDASHHKAVNKRGDREGRRVLLMPALTHAAQNSDLRKHLRETRGSRQVQRGSGRPRVPLYVDVLRPDLREVHSWTAAAPTFRRCRRMPSKGARSRVKIPAFPFTTLFNA